MLHKTNICFYLIGKRYYLIEKGVELFICVRFDHLFFKDITINPRIWLMDIDRLIAKIKQTFGAQSFTSLKADLRQGINGSFAFSRLHNRTFPWRKSSILVSYLRRDYLYFLIFSFGLMYQCLNGAIPSRKCSMKTHAKCKTSIYVLTEICLQGSKRLRS